jgi:hypothetical protein
MSISFTLDRLHFRVKQNRWLRYFAVFNRTITLQFHQYESRDQK